MTTTYNSFPLTFGGILGAFPFEIDRAANPIVSDSQDEFSLPEHNSWGVQAGLPLPKALRAFK